MSDCIMQIIPAQPDFSLPEKQAARLGKTLKKTIRADDAEVFVYPHPVFVDCGSNLESIACPHCGAPLDFDWWVDAMDTAGEGDFLNLRVTLPCCSRESTLHDLQYDFPCGFARLVFSFRNPEENLTPEQQTGIERKIGCAVRVIYAHL